MRRTIAVATIIEPISDSNSQIVMNHFQLSAQYAALLTFARLSNVVGRIPDDQAGSNCLIEKATGSGYWRVWPAECRLV